MTAISEGGESAVIEAPPIPREETKRDERSKKQPPYHVILWDDDDHSFGYVITMLQQLFGYPPEKGYQLAKEVDANGRVILCTTTRERAELKRDQVHAYGKDDMIAGCKGSMKATIQPSH